MARKKLLSEGEVRQFMKLANLGALSENYFSTNTLEEEEEEVVVDDEFPPAEDEEIVDELPGEEDMGLEAADEGAEGLVMSLLQRVQDWAEENGVEMDLDGDEGGDELDAELEDEVPLPDEEMGMEMGAEEELPVQEDELYEGDLAEVGQVASLKHPKTRRPGVPRSKDRDPKSACAPGEHWNAELKQCDPGKAAGEEAMVAEVARRVAARLKGVKRTATVADQLAERIFDRLTSKSK